MRKSRTHLDRHCLVPGRRKDKVYARSGLLDYTRSVHSNTNYVTAKIVEAVRNYVLHKLTQVHSEALRSDGGLVQARSASRLSAQDNLWALGARVESRGAPLHFSLGTRPM